MKRGTASVLASMLLVAVLVGVMNPSWPETFLVCLSYAVGFHVARRLT